jgi:hypothetical protein
MRKGDFPAISVAKMLKDNFLDIKLAPIVMT